MSQNYRLGLVCMYIHVPQVLKKTSFIKDFPGIDVLTTRGLRIYMYMLWFQFTFILIFLKLV